VPVPVLLDCDPGHDDVVAIATAAHWCDLIGVTTVSGNVALEHTTRNALVTVQLLDCDVPVHAGASEPLECERLHAAHVHGDTGLAGASFPEVLRTVVSDDAVSFIIESAHAVAGLWLVATGPLTNVAHALQRDLSIAGRLAGISIMGGGTFGNVTAAAEFNIYADPEAADIVFRSDARVTMCGLDLTHQVLVDDALVERCAALPNAFGPFCASFLGEYLATVRRLTGSDVDAALHDPCAVLTVARPELFGFASRGVAVELRGTHTRGMTLIDRREWMTGPVQVAETVDSQAALAAIVEAISAAP
jgi:inosine-uridine nucleoside N-ribohydrolase